MFDRTQLQEAIALLSAQRARYGDATIDTAVEVLEERLEQLAERAVAPATVTTLPDEQRKQATVLFATIDGFTRMTGVSRNTDRLRQIDLIWRQLDEMILYHGGMVDKHMGDVIMGIFGAPFSRENDPERAVRCALALCEMVNESLRPLRENVEDNPVIRIGINTGQVSLGRVGSDVGQTVIGDAVNVASRLKGAAEEGGIYVSQDTYRLVRNLFHVDPLGEIAIKGRQTPVTVYRITGARPRFFFPDAEGVEGITVPMIGRDAEMNVLQDALRQTAREGHGGLITIVGEAGVGKSRLGREFLRRIGAFPFKATVFQARTDQRLAQVPLSLLRELLISHFEIDERDRSKIIEDKIIKGLAGVLSAEGRETRNAEIREWGRAISRLVMQGLSVPQRPESLSVGPTIRQDRAIEYILEYFTAVARHSAVTLFFLEDIHWADEDSLAVLERVSAAAADSPALMICLARPTLYERRPNWPGESDATVIRLPLMPLSDADSRELVLSILRKLPQIPPALSDLIVRSAAGNPFYVEELVRVLIEDGVIVPDESAWHLRQRELTRLRVPATLTGVLQARLDRLPELERTILQQAAVVGDEFWAEAVGEVNRGSRFPFAQEQMTAALQSLERRDMIYRAPTPVLAAGRAYLFKHAILREVAYESVLLRDRPGYHLQVARWLEAQRGDAGAEYAAPIAQHHELAGRSAEAARMYELAAGSAAEQYKFGGAIDYYRKVLDLLRNLPQYFDTRLSVKDRLGQALRQQSRFVEALEVYRAMQHSAALDGNLLSKARAEIALAAIYHEQGDDASALVAATEAEQSARLTGAEIELARALRLRAEAMSRLDRHAEAIDAATQSLELARLLDAPRETVNALALLGNQRATEELQTLAGVLEERAATDDAAYALARLGELHLSLGQTGAAREALERALALYRAAGSRGGAGEVLRLMGLAGCRAGDPDAIGYLEEAAALAEATGNRYLRLGCRLAMGEALLAREQYPAAEATLRQVIAVAEDRRRLGGWMELPHAYDLLVEVLNRQGRGDEARLVKDRLKQQED